MMNQQQQPDNFFREKLQNYQKPAPAGAWDRIESALEKKTNYKFAWWKIAASLVLVAGTTYVLWFHYSDSTQKPLAHTENKITPLAPSKSEPANPGRTADVQPQTTTEERKPTDIPQHIAKTPASKKITEQVKISSIIPKETLPVEENDIEQTPEEPVTPPVILRDTPVSKSTITLTITSDETNRYLDKDALAEATSEEKKPSTLKKFLKKANDLKSNQDPFGELRERKNEILALNFKNDKRGQNK